ncbi:Acyl-CoA synthetase (AMP-forming)/AMP-acid ligase II [Frankia sp. AiPs1]|uniref:alpha/beta fold hydrolase n=1 Tax=Frankia sp. AiPa1 TaxID=573492 RepID=UPI00202B1E5C|nr:alpha/beta fold hydrolase [Frankia sp. AiPa1]MCL9761825.1 alpha/beta fold hydrolase [Frankia sp. AiPa1]
MAVNEGDRRAALAVASPGGDSFSMVDLDTLPDSVVSRFREVAARLPQTPALVSPGVSLTFAEADRRTDDIAVAILGRLDASEVGPVATLLPHGVAGLLGVLAAMKTGRPVVPLDPMVPPERMAQIIRQAGCVALMTDLGDATVDRSAVGLGPVDAGWTDPPTAPHIDARPLLDLLADSSPRLVLDLAAAASDGSEWITANGTDAVWWPEPGIDEPACVVFTSGSTGTPKGVVWTHGTFLSEAYAGAARLGFAPGDRVALVLPYSFAAGITVVVFGLLNGAGLYAYDPRSAGLRGLADWIITQNLTALPTTPSLLRALLGVLEADEALPDLRVVTTCGEATYGRDIVALRPHLSAICLYTNWTGASEIASLGFHVIPASAPVPEGTIPGGRPAPGKEVVLRREDGSVAALGEVGEVEVTSAHLSAGYWQNPELTAEKFTPRPDGRTTCRTGDLGRFEPDGTLVLLGRRDAAVKIRGYLVEPSEVEAALLRSPEIAEAVVTAVTDPGGPARLIAYVVPAVHGNTLSPARVRRALRERLPIWMVPATIVPIAGMPRNERGKVDRGALPPPPAAPAISKRPRTQWEIVVADIWTRVLDLEEVGVGDDFMELGGDSLAANELLTLVQEKLGLSLPSSTLVDSPTLGAFAHAVSLAQQAGPRHPTVVPLRTTGSRPPLFCFAGAGALALGFHSLARRLGDDQPVYAIQAHGLERRGFPDWSVEKTARRHLEVIRLLAPRGPYLLAGHSLGGLIAMEIAQQLAAAGEEVGFLSIMDTYLPASLRMDAAAEATPMPTPAAARDDQEHASNYRRRLARFTQRLLPEQRANFTNLATLKKMVQIPLTGVVQFDGLEQFDVFFNHGRLLERFYRPRPWAGRTLVYRSAENPDPESAWSTYLTGSHDTHYVPCEHFYLLREPHVIRISEHFREEIDRVVAEQARRG